MGRIEPDIFRFVGAIEEIDDEGCAERTNVPVTSSQR